MPMRTFQHTVTPADTATAVGSGDLEVLATPRLITWCESAAFEVCRPQTDEDRTTVGTFVKIEHVKGTPVGAEVSVSCAEPISDGRRLVCFVTVTDPDGETLASGEVHRAVVDRERFMSKCHPVA
ncbi:thioesterase [Intrasporangium chromatireducens Q5-1]|uniref:Thioesterase n=1 Tax=Intrasporangium chromatireducens Q5-1 TaxID=584657 RepID=W9GKR0_9MICO|nr:thioesterase [Intrasporangium chromatireducens]EWT06851.1 thioesterase [Intrasporangium chromatireducens Q5-1]